MPVYNSDTSLGTLTDRLCATLANETTAFEIILVNDGSRDNSWGVISDLANRYPEVRGLGMLRNYGQHNALLAGIRAARYEIIVTMDDDCQHPPEELPKLLAKLDEGHDVVYGVPYNEQHGFWRDIASQTTKLALQSTMGAEVARKVSSFRVFRTKIRDAFATYRSPLLCIDVLLTWGTTHFSAVPVRHDPRLNGVSNYRFGMLVTHAMNMMTGFSTIPLQIASLIGFAFTCFGGLVLVYVLGRYLVQGVSVPGFAFLAATIAIFSGAQLFALGIVGEYLARMYVRMMERPNYVIGALASYHASNDGIQTAGLALGETAARLLDRSADRTALISSDSSFGGENQATRDEPVQAI